MQKTRTVFVVLLMVFAGGIPAFELAAQDPSYTLRLTSETVSGLAISDGETVNIQAFLDFADGLAVAGASFGVCADPSFVTVNCVGGIPNDCIDNGIIVAGETLAQTNGGAGPQFFAPATALAPVEGWTVGIVVNLLGGDSITPTDGAELTRTQYDVFPIDPPPSDDISIPLSFCETGQPLVLISVGLAGGGDVLPVLADGEIMITGVGEFCIENFACAGGVSDALLTWDRCGPFDYYALNRNGIFVDLLDGEDSEYLDADLAPGMYHYELIGVAFPDPNGPPTIVVADCDTQIVPVTLTDIDPSTAYFIGGDTITLSGTGFDSDPDIAVTLGGAPAKDVAVIDDSTLTFVTPAVESLGPVDVTVTNRFGTDTLTDGLLFGFIRGEVDGDGDITLQDSIFGLDYIFSNGPAPVCLDSLDFDDDGLIDIQDPGDILEFLFQMGLPPALPYPEPGLDPTPDDGVGCI